MDWDRVVRREYRPPDEPPPIFTVLVVGVLVEWFRQRHHPGAYNVVAMPELFRIAAVGANVGFHMWNRPTSVFKAAASSFLTQVSIPTVLAILGTMGGTIVAAVIQALSELTAP